MFRFVFIIYPLLSFYLGFIAWRTLFRFIPHLKKSLYWLLISILAVAYLIPRMVSNLPDSINYPLTLIGAYWMAVVFYLTLITLVLGAIKVLGKILGLKSGWSKQKPHPVALGVLILVAAILIYGTWNAHTPRIAHYDLNIPKQAGMLNKLHVVMVSDTHLDIINGQSRLNVMVNAINKLNPDIVLLAGDMYDDQDLGIFDRQKMGDILKQLHPKYGVFGVMGNHDAQGMVIKYENANINMLLDETSKIADSFYLIGRNNLSRGHSSQQRKDLSLLMKQVDPKYPVILMDHQPNRLEEADQLGVDLQLSGHTHAGQIFPGRLITKKIYEMDWGYLVKKHLQVIVSCGYGTWGPPIRVGTNSEIVDLELHFK